jgi:ribonuclease P protein component
LAFVVSKRLGKAHVRNQIKRRLREAARLNQDLWPTGTDVVLRATQSRVASMDFAALSQDVRNSLGKLAVSKR